MNTMLCLFCWHGGGGGGGGGCMGETGSQIINWTASFHIISKVVLEVQCIYIYPWIYIKMDGGDCVIIVQNITQNNVHSSRVDLIVPVFGGASCMLRLFVCSKTKVSNKLACVQFRPYNSSLTPYLPFV